MLHRAIVVTTKPGEQLLQPSEVRGFWDRLPFKWRADQSWLKRNEAWEGQILVETAEQAAEALAQARDRLAGAVADINMVKCGPSRKKRLIVADMESTIIEQEMLDELADYIGERKRISDITERAMRGELDFEGALKERVGLLKDLGAGTLDEAYDKRVTAMPGAATLVSTMRRHGAYAALVSGGFTVFTSKVAERFGFDTHQANTLVIAKGRLTGTVTEPILGREAKLAALRRFTEELKLTPADTLAVGDGANDLDMLGAAGLGVAFRAKPKVREAAAAFPGGAVVTHGDLTALLYLQGYRADEFAAA
jgi:phosphoserine phosphatase